MTPVQLSEMEESQEFVVRLSMEDADSDFGPAHLSIDLKVSRL
ncbi:hypothetical protein [Nocardia abscessus]|nr:hypothetical protein [Nocardia abscessus]